MGCTNWRGVEERLQHMLDNPPGKTGQCARECWQALGGDLPSPCPPAWGTPNANAVYDKVMASGRYWRGDDIPRGALIVWRYGANGHTALSAGLGRIVTTDPSGRPGGTGYESLGYPERWGATPARRLYTDTYNGVRFDIGGSMSNVYDYGLHGAESVLRVSTSYVRLVGAAEWNPRRDGLQFGKLYLKVGAVKFKSGKTAGALRVKCVRDDPTDPTWYHDVIVVADALDSAGESTHSFASFESGDQERNLHWEVKCIAGLESCSLATSRYAGWAVIGD